MTDFIFHIIVIGALAIGAVRGFRERFTQQIPCWLAIFFALLCSHIFLVPAEDWVAEVLKEECKGVDGEFVLSNLASTLIFIIAFTVFYLCTFILKFFFRLLDTGLLDNVLGALGGMLHAAIFISMAYNLWLSLFPESRLLKYAMHDDGDIVHEVMLLSPFLLGSESVDELAHKFQLEQAKYIS
ncbi:MAG: CvpA family protein [Muribaculaceae bacterium]|nr:CvpA family protein [Muribaculaceae bacterium]